MSPEKAFTQQQKDAMVAAIKQAEKDTSGEIRVRFCPLKYAQNGAKKRGTDLRGLTGPQIRNPWRCRD